MPNQQDDVRLQTLLDRLTARSASHPGLLPELTRDHWMALATSEAAHLSKKRASNSSAALWPVLEEFDRHPERAHAALLRALRSTSKGQLRVAAHSAVEEARYQRTLIAATFDKPESAVTTQARPM